MTFKSFLKYVELQTKVASVTPFLLGTLYSLYRYKEFRFINFIIMFISLLSFDMATTAINNYIDFKKANKVDGQSHGNQNIIVIDKIKESTAITVIFVLLMVAMVFGLILTLKTNILVLVIGSLSFVVGVLYTFGPIPISRMPLGEIFSGFFMGFVIMFLSIYIQIYDKNIITLLYNNGIIALNINMIEFIYIFLMAVPAIGGIANIMLANNICDMEEDIINNRFTLPYYLGRKNALKLFKGLYYVGYLDIIIMVALGVAPLALLLVLFTFIPVNKGIKSFYERQIKQENFVVSVKNFLIMNGSQVIIVAIVVLVRSLS